MLFSKSEFLGPVHFDSTVGLADSAVRHSIYRAPISFDAAELRAIEFDEVTFHDFATFRKTRFEDGATFRRTMFERGVDLADAVFQADGEVTFDGAGVRSGDACFAEVRFLGPVEFRSC